MSIEQIKEEGLSIFQGSKKAVHQNTQKGDFKELDEMDFCYDIPAHCDYSEEFLNTL